MKWPNRKTGEARSVELQGRARIDVRTKRLVQRLESGQIAVIDHEDLDGVAAQALIEKRPSAVINAATSSTGKYPNLGPLALASAGIALVDSCGPQLLSAVNENDWLRIEGSRVYRNGSLIASGNLVDVAQAQSFLDQGKQRLGVALEEFVENTLRFVREEKDLLIEGVRLPEIKTALAGRHVLVVVRGVGHKEDLRTLGAYIREMRPVLLGVDGGADALLEAGYQPHLIIGDMDSVSADALRCGAEILLHAYPDGRAPGLERLERHNIAFTLFEAPGTSEDLALLLADGKGAELIVAVGAHANLVEFLDKGRGGMASTFLVRLRVGPRLVDAKGVSSLYRGRVRVRDLMLLVVAAFACMLVVIAVSQPSRITLVVMLDLLRNMLFSLREWLPG